MSVIADSPLGNSSTSRPQRQESDAAYGQEASKVRHYQQRFEKKPESAKNHREIAWNSQKIKATTQGGDFFGFERQQRNLIPTYGK
jgi:hypothetical protein